MKVLTIAYTMATCNERLTEAALLNFRPIQLPSQAESFTSVLVYITLQILLINTTHATFFHTVLKEAANKVTVTIVIITRKL